MAYTIETAISAMRKELFDELLESVKQAVAIERGEMKPSRSFTVGRKNEVTAARARLGLSQNKFAALLGISSGTLKNWEQGRRRPTGPAKVLLKVARRHPKIILEAAA
jgi:putative transcriptional regulator